MKASMEDGTKEDGTDIVQKPSASSVVDDSRITAIPGGKNTTAITICIILAVIILAIIIGILVLSRMKKQEKERIRREKIRRMQQKKRMSTESANRNEMRYDSRYTQKAQPLTGRQSSDKTQASDRQARRVSRSSNGTYRSSNNWRR